MIVSSQSKERLKVKFRLNIMRWESISCKLDVGKLKSPVSMKKATQQYQLKRLPHIIPADSSVIERIWHMHSKNISPKTQK